MENQAKDFSAARHPRQVLRLSVNLRRALQDLQVDSSEQAQAVHQPRICLEDFHPLRSPATLQARLRLLCSAPAPATLEPPMHQHLEAASLVEVPQRQQRRPHLEDSHLDKQTQEAAHQRLQLEGRLLV